DRFAPHSPHPFLSWRNKSARIWLMLRNCVVLFASVFCGLQAGLADSIQLKDKAAITGKILAEKKDQVAIDVGYTVLVIPRNQVVKISKTDAIEASPKTPTAAPKAV